MPKAEGWKPKEWQTEIDLTCPHCNTRHEVSSDPLTTGKPEPGNISICWRCFKIAVFTENDLRLPTPEEQAQVEAQDDYKKIMGAMRESRFPDDVRRLLLGD